MGVRAEQQAKRDRVVMAAATELFWKQGYSATTIPMIAEMSRAGFDSGGTGIVIVTSLQLKAS